MSDKYILNDVGEPEPCDDLMAWARWFEKDAPGRIVAKDIVGEARVSTVFLSIDHAFGHGEPVLWETMIFGGPHDGYQERYTSKTDALAGHAKALALISGAAS